jgi:cobalt-zinc-cadmium efflux system outer membrane protein
MPEPSGRITLGDALAAALARSPVLASSSFEVRAREALAFQAALRRNPEVSLEVEDFAGSGERHGFRSQQTTVSFAQVLELGGKRARRSRLAEAERDLATWEYEAARLAVLGSTTRAFVAVLAIQEKRALAEELRRIASRSVDTVAATVRSGAVSPIERERAQVDLERVGIEVDRLGRELEAARAALAATWGGREARFEFAIGELSIADAPPELALLEDRLGESPELARYDAALAAARAALALERSQRIPDVVAGIGGRYYSDPDGAALVAQLSVPIPVFDRNAGRMLEARYRESQLSAQRAASEAKLCAELVADYQALAASRAQAQALRDRVIPHAETVFRGTQDGYGKGLFRYVEVLDAQRTLFETRSQLVDSLASYHEAAADLEALVGTPLGHLSNAGRRP